MNIQDLSTSESAMVFAPFKKKKLQKEKEIE